MPRGRGKGSGGERRGNSNSWTEETRRNTSTRDDLLPSLNLEGSKLSSEFEKLITSALCAVTRETGGRNVGEKEKLEVMKEPLALAYTMIACQVD